MDYINASVEENDEIRRAAKKIVLRKKMVKVLCVILAVIILLLVVAGAAWISGQKRGKEGTEKEIKEREEQIHQLEKRIKEMQDNPIVVSPVAPKIELSVISNQIQNIGELATVEYLFTDAGTYSDSTQIKDLFDNAKETNKLTEWTIPLTEKSFTLKWDGVIKAGIDVTQVKLEESKLEKKIIVSVPSAEILSYDIDENSVEILDEKNNVFNPITIDDKLKFDKKTEEAMKQRAIENGLLEKAQKNAESIISGVILSNPTVSDEYTLEFVVN